MKLSHKIKKLDKRYNGSLDFKYMVDVRKATAANKIANHLDKIREFDNIRRWAWETYGPSSEITFYRRLELDSVWSWDQEHDNLRIYLKSDKEASWFQLKWSE